MPSRRHATLKFVAALLFVSMAHAWCQMPACPVVADHAATPAEAAYSEGRFADAEALDQQALSQKPQDALLTAALVRTLLREGKVAQASSAANAALVANPHAAPLLTALAEVQLRLGEPWLALQSLDAAAAADHCYARQYLIRSRALRIDSMYASERKEIRQAYAIDPNDADIQHAWQSIIAPADEVQGTEKSLSTMNDLDADTRQKAEATMQSLLPLLHEGSETCQPPAAVTTYTLPLQPTFADGKHINGYQLEVELPQGKARMILDTAASGLFITRAMAQQNSFQPAPGDPPGTVRAATVRIGPLEFHNCIVGVSDAPFAGRADGFIGTDIFAPWLVGINYRLAKLTLAPLPQQSDVLPADRSQSPDLAGFTPVYHRRQYLLVPIDFPNQSRKLFILATGMRSSAMTSEAAHTLSKMTMNFTNSEQTTTGAKVQFYRETFDMQLANLAPIHQGHILELDPSVIDQNAGFEIAGMLGLDVLQPLNLQLDYRDGLVKFESATASNIPTSDKSKIASASRGAQPESSEPACNSSDMADRPVNSTIEAKVTGSVDLSHLKPGKEIWVQVVHGLTYPGCTLDANATIYGHVISATSSKNPAAAEASLQFDHGDCTGHQKQPLSLRLIALVAPPDNESKRMHDITPTEVAGGGRQIGGSPTSQDATSGGPFDDNLNPQGPPQTVHPGIVIRMPELRLDPIGGPGCSARLTSTGRAIRFGPGSELILTMFVPAH
jgi:hypothetical protein